MNRFTPNEVAKPVRLLAIIAIIASLYFARDLLIPAALAILFAFLLNPLVRGMTRWGLNHAAAVVIAVSLGAAATAGVGLLVANQVLELSDRLPDYRDNLRQKVRAVRQNFSGEGTVSRITGTLKELRDELSTSQPVEMSATQAVTSPPEPTPVKVAVIDEGPELNDVIIAFAGPLLVPAAAAGITILLLIFLLLHADDIRERFISFAGLRQISLTTTAMDETATRVGRYLRMQLMVNVSYGLMIGIGLAIFGVPNALLWGVMGALLRFIPYVGAWISAILPVLLTAAVFPGWSTLVGVVVMLSCAELLTNMVLEPWLYGTSSGMSSLGVVVATVFWAWVWGPVGMILAVPITVCLTVIGKHVPQLALLNHFFGTDSTVPVASRLYHWLLAGDESAAEKLVAEEGKALSLVEICDKLLIPVLIELKRDYTQGLIGLPQVRKALSTLEASLPIDVHAASQAGATAPRAMVCIPGRTEIDACAARLLATAANEAHVPARVISSGSLLSEAAKEAESAKVSAVAIVQIVPSSAPLIRQFVKLAEGKIPNDIPVVDIAAGSEAPDTIVHVSQRKVRQEHTFAGLISRMTERAHLQTAPETLPPPTAPVAIA